MHEGPKARIPDCPLARTVGAVGPWWTLEILHELFDGHTRFEAIRRNLEMDAGVLAERMSSLLARDLVAGVEDGPVSGGRVSGGPDAGGPEAEGAEAGVAAAGSADPEGPEYRLTGRGRALRPLILVMAAWGNHLLAPEDRSLVLVDAETGAEADPVVVDRLTGRRLDTAGYVFAPGPAASGPITARYPAVPRR
ncbi:helix-turn-helix domain-containing protein [Streptomyces sp. NPDC089799]|uniref:winged helix-turn-helix transcriptional regulator n=1 Tax=Streptomyces sp. NPDC089799 TaxID=3155066 RepID=UPI00341E44BA